MHHVSDLLGGNCRCEERGGNPVDAAAAPTVLR